MIGEAVRAGLRRQGFAVDWVRDGIAAEQGALRTAKDLDLLRIEQRQELRAHVAEREPVHQEADRLEQRAGQAAEGAGRVVGAEADD